MCIYEHRPNTLRYTTYFEFPRKKQFPETDDARTPTATPKKEHKTETERRGRMVNTPP
jgi:hypothetical protein